MPPVIYADFRCLQDQNFQGRGIGHHTAAILRARKASALANAKLIGLIDARLPPLPESFRDLADEVTSSVNPCLKDAPAIFVDGSPMTHDTRFALRFQNSPGVMNAAILYDFIPLDWPGYLPTPATRIEYAAKIARLKKFDLFLPISDYTATRARELLGVGTDRVRVTGACVRSSLYDISARLTDRPSPYDQRQPYFVTFGGDDRRKNTGTAIRAVRRLNLIYGRRIPLKVIGFYSRGYKAELLQAAGQQEDKGFVEFYPNTLEEKMFVGSGTNEWRRPSVSDEEVVSLHAGAIAAIAPSHIEGFSLPVAEAAVCGCPVIASSCAAHMELITQTEALFHSDDVDELCRKAEVLLHNAELRNSLLVQQAQLAPRYHEAAVGERFWQAVEERVVLSRPKKISISHSPRIALLSPYPPDRSEAALYTQELLRTGGHGWTPELYTDAQRPLEQRDAAYDAGRVSPAPLLDRGIKAIVSVISDSPQNRRILEFVERYGGPCILHDLKLTTAYLSYLGQQLFLDYAEQTLGRSIGMEEVHTWLEERVTPPLILSGILAKASPIIVMSPAQQLILKQQFAVDAELTTCSPTLVVSDRELTPEYRERTRHKYNMSSNDFAIAVFGRVSRANGRDVALLAVDLLRSWNVPAKLYYIGDVADSEKSEIRRIADIYRIGEHIYFGGDLEEAEAYRDFLIGADVSLQLRAYAYGQVSVAVANSVGAALPCVTTIDAALACEAPGFVSTIPDHFSPLHAAERLASLWENPIDRVGLLEMRTRYLETHNFDYYRRRLLEILVTA